MQALVVSIGYEGRDVHEFSDLLKKHGVSLLVDVRLNPISRKTGFSKNALAKALEGVGIGYRHEPASATRRTTGTNSAKAILMLGPGTRPCSTVRHHRRSKTLFDSPLMPGLQ